MKTIALLTAALLLTSIASSKLPAQDNPLPRPDRPEAREGDRLRESDRPREGERPRPGFSNFDGPGMGAPGYVPPIDAMRQYLDLVDRYTRLASDPSAAGVAAVITANDMLRQRGPDAAIRFFTNALERAQNDAVRRAIRLQLIDLYKNSGQQDKALEQLENLIVSTPRSGQPGPRFAPDALQSDGPRPEMARPDAPRPDAMRETPRATDRPREGEGPRRPDQPREDRPQ